MNSTRGLVIRYPVKDIALAKALFRELLGVAPYLDEAYYVGFRVGDLEIGLDPHGHNKGMTGPVGYWNTEDIERSLNALVSGGAQVQQQVSDVGGGVLVATVLDASDNVIGLMQRP